jgi:hypothetical protein
LTAGSYISSRSFTRTTCGVIDLLY